MPLDLVSPELASRILDQKALARRNQSARNLHVLVGTLLGLLGTLVWLLLWPDQAPSPIASLLLGVGAGALGGFGLVFRPGGLASAAKAACPSCGLGWEIKESRTSPPRQVMTNWDKCPGCGCCMNDALLRATLSQSGRAR